MPHAAGEKQEMTNSRMKKIELNSKEINDWKRDNWNLYASTSLPWRNNKTKLLRFWINGNGWFRIVFGDDVIYEGTQLTNAIASWDSAAKYD